MDEKLCTYLQEHGYLTRYPGGEKSLFSPPPQLLTTDRSWVGEQPWASWAPPPSLFIFLSTEPHCVTQAKFSTLIPPTPFYFLIFSLCPISRSLSESPRAKQFRGLGLGNSCYPLSCPSHLPEEGILGESGVTIPLS